MICKETAPSENLRDAGCSDSVIESFLKLCEQGAREEQLKLLSEERKKLLESLHKDQKRLDCLDYLICKLRKKS